MENLKIIARIESDFPTKFGIPRQSGLVKNVSTVVFEPSYRVDEALRGIEDFSHVWLIWGFSEAERSEWSPTVRPPRLGGNVRKGVFATRSPYRPNPLGLSSVRLIGTEKTDRGTVLKVEGADLMDGTPIYDIKPYLPLSDCHTDATDGFSGEVKDYALKVTIPERTATLFTAEQKEVLKGILSQDPRPAYQDDPTRVYGFFYADFEIKFTVDGDELTVVAAQKTNKRTFLVLSNGDFGK